MSKGLLQSFPWDHHGSFLCSQCWPWRGNPGAGSEKERPGSRLWLLPSLDLISANTPDILSEPVQTVLLNRVNHLLLTHRGYLHHSGPKTRAGHSSPAICPRLLCGSFINQGCGKKGHIHKCFTCWSWYGNDWRLEVESMQSEHRDDSWLLDIAEHILLCLGTWSTFLNSICNLVASISHHGHISSMYLSICLGWNFW